MTAQAQQRTYLPQLDGVRGLAIISVLVMHIGYSPAIRNIAQWGRLGVILFFVLSGFLITGILLRQRDYCINNRVSTWPACYSFYARRVLRIFPAYYLTIFIAAAVGFAPVSEHLIWHLTYTSNYGTAFLDMNWRNAAHLWSLCVEEQFYLFWPFIILFTPREALPRIIIGIILSTLVYKTIAANQGLSYNALSTPLFACLESLGCGALLALFWHEPERYRRTKQNVIRLGLLVGIPSYVGLQWMRFRLGHTESIHTPTYTVLVDLAASLACLPLIDKAARNTVGMLGAFLCWAPLRYLGRISYGVYLYHMFLKIIFYNLGIDLPRYLKFPVMSAVTILLATVSWFAFERPLNNLKKHFAYRT